MIFEAIVKALAAVAKGIASLFGDIPAPGWLTSVGDSWGELMGQLGGLGAWIPWGTAQTVVTAVLACVALGFGIRLVRMVVSLLTGGGGSAA